MRRALLLLAAAAAVAVPATSSNAEVIPPPVVIEHDGGCPSGYREVARAGQTVVCVINIRVPGVRPTTNGCAADEQGYLVDGRYGACVR